MIEPQAEENSMLDDMLDQAIDEPAVENPADKPPEAPEVMVVAADLWALPEMVVGSNKVIKHEIDPSLSRKSKSKKQIKADEKLTAIQKLKENYQQQWREELKKEIFDEASDKGFQEGFDRGLTQSLKETNRLHEQLRSFMHCFEAPIEMINQEVEKQLELLAVTLAQQLVRREIKTNPDEIVGLIRESIKLLPASSRKIKITIHPEDAALVKEALAIDDMDDDLKWSFIEDPMLTRGGCVIKSAQSVINVTLENRLASLAASVLSSNRSADDPQKTTEHHQKEASSLEPEPEPEQFKSTDA